MAEKIVWESDDGKIYDTEIEALIANAYFWKKKYEELRKNTIRRYDDHYYND